MQKRSKKFQNKITKNDFDEEIEKINENKIILVEGNKDKIALKKFGIKNKIIILNKPLFKIVENIAENTKQVILLTDLDSEGKKLYSKIKKDLQKFGVKIDDKFREFLFKTNLRQIEGMKKYYDKLD
ncbi:MAG: toprim domain-containing protein [Candidatus Woesearchaeota archaeon]